MRRESQLYQTYVQILWEELIPAAGCTEPISIAYAAAKARELLGRFPERVEVAASGNLIKNVKSVVVPNTGGMKGIAAAAAAGIVAGQPERELEVIAQVSPDQIEAIKACLNTVPIQVRDAESDLPFDLLVAVWGAGSCVKLRIAHFHTNIVRIEKDGEVLLERPTEIERQGNQTRNKLLSIADIYDFAETVHLEDVQKLLLRQTDYNMAIALEGLSRPYGANIGKVLSRTYTSTDVAIRAKAAAAAGSDARMSGCELPVIINSGSGNQGITVSVPIVVYAQELGASVELMYRALVLSNLLAIYLKSQIGTLSAYCGAVSAGASAGAGLAYLQGGGYEGVVHTLVNALAVTSGIICDGAKASCAAKIAAAVDAGILGYHMYQEGEEFLGGDGIVAKGAEATVRNVVRLGKQGMSATDKEIIQIMIGA